MSIFDFNVRVRQISEKKSPVIWRWSSGAKKKGRDSFARQGAVRREQRVEYLDKLAPENHPQGESKRIFTHHHPRDTQHHRTGDGVVQQRV